MGTRTFRPAQTGYSRVFIIEGRARPDHKPEYQSNMKAGSLSQSFGDITKIEIPDPDEFGKFLEVASIREASERVTISLTGRYAADLKSKLAKLAKSGCAFDVHIILGVCTDPKDYNTFTKKIILESALLTNFETEDIGALGSDEAAKVDETAELSAREFYELLQVSIAERGGDVVTNEVNDVVLCDTASCGDCQTESDGCEVYFAVTNAAGGSPSTPPDILWTPDGGTTWYAHDIDTMLATENADAVTCNGAYVLVAGQTSGGLHFTAKSSFSATSDPVFTKVTTGFVTGAGPRDLWTADGRTFVAGANGYIYYSDTPADGVTVADASVSNPLATYNAIHASSMDNAVAVGNGGAIAKTENGETWSRVDPFVGVAVNLNTVWVKSASEWLVGTSAGNLHYTLDAGETWTIKAFPGSGTGQVHNIWFATDSVVYMAHATAAGVGRLLRSTNGGYDWVVMPEGVGSMPDNDRINAVAACGENPDKVVGVGLAGNGTDGFIVVGSD